MQLSDGAEVNSSLTSWLPVVVESFSVCMLSLLHVQDFFPERLILLTYSNFRPTPRHRCFYRSNTCLYRSHLCIWCNTKNKFLIANVGDIRDESSISGLGWSPGRGHGNPLQYTCLENPICDFEPGGPQSTGSQRVRYDLRWLEKAMAPHSSTLAWKIPWTEEPCGLQSMRSPRVGHDWATSLSLFTFMHWRRKWQPTPVFLAGESQERGSLVGCCLWIVISLFMKRYVWMMNNFQILSSIPVMIPLERYTSWSDVE